MAFIPPRGDTGFTLGGFLILAMLGTFLWKGAPLDSVRPTSNEVSWEPSGYELEIPARLWQDPFKAIANNSSILDDLKKRSGKGLDQFVTRLNKESQAGQVHVLLAMLTPGFHAETEEQRRRRRYAVISGLNEESFVPDMSATLKLFYYQDHQQKHAASETFAGDFKRLKLLEPPKPFPISYEWFHLEDDNSNNQDQHKVVVLWLDESKFASSPLNFISLLLEDITIGIDKQDRSNISVSMLGPNSSGTLQNLVYSDQSFAQKWLRKRSGLNSFSIISHSATVDDSDLTPPGNNADVLTDISQFRRNFDGRDCEYGTTKRIDGSKTTCMRFLRTISSDRDLLKKLSDEFTNNQRVRKYKDKIILISESDTYFGRSLPRSFIREYCRESGKPEHCRDNILSISYQRGLDGRTGDKSVAAGSTDNISTSEDIDYKDLRRPTGTGQYDYLRRLAEDLAMEQSRLRVKEGSQIKAVILLGSDVYDKLLIMRALRPALPHAIFATTDLNSQLIHPAEYSWARNLIVVTTYNLTLSDKVAMKTMPMRDTYQTSTYLATRLLFNHDMQHESQLHQHGLDQLIQPQLLEIGKNTLVKLDDGIDPRSTWNHLSSSSYFDTVSFASLLLTILVLFSIYQLVPGARNVRIVVITIAGVFAIMSFMIMTRNGYGEPYDLLSGTSIWPTVYIRLVSIILSGAFIWYVICHLRENYCQLTGEYIRYDTGSNIHLNTRPTPARIYLYVAAAAMLLVLLFKRELLWLLSPGLLDELKELSLKPAAEVTSRLAAFAGIWVVVAMLWWLHLYGWFYRAIAIILNSTLSVIDFIMSSLPVGRLNFRYLKVISDRFEVRPINDWPTACKDSGHSIVDVWKMYGEYGSAEDRLSRTIAYIIIYTAIATVIFVSLGSSPDPCRGTFACSISEWVIRIAVIMMFILLFLVVDAARLCIFWVQSLKDPRFHWHGSKLDYFRKRLKLPQEEAKIWMLVHLIGERTDAVTRLIYLPVLIILLLLLSRSTIFDNWHFPQALAIIVSLNFIVALGSVVILNFTALSVRKELLRKLETDVIAGQRETEELNTASRSELIRQLSTLETGAYLPFWRQPPIRATLMLIGGFALTFAEYFNNIIV